jgi:hypothetical protein
MLLPMAIAGGRWSIFAVFPCRRCFLAVFFGRLALAGQRFCGFPQPAADNLLQKQQKQRRRRVKRPAERVILH